MLEAVVFDMDGVILDSEACNLLSAREAFAGEGVELTPGDEVEIPGRHPIDYIEFLGARHGIPKERHEALRARQTAAYYRLWEARARLNEGAVEVLDALRGRGLLTGLATSGSRVYVDKTLARFGISGRFHTVLTKDDVGRRKPDPEIYLLALQRLGTAAEAALVVEDSEHGVLAAHRAGIRCLALTSPFTPPERIPTAWKVISSLREVLEFA